MSFPRPTQIMTQHRGTLDSPPDRDERPTTSTGESRIETEGRRTTPSFLTRSYDFNGSRSHPRLRRIQCLCSPTGTNGGQDGVGGYGSTYRIK